MNETLWHVTVLSNLIRGYDKYTRTYSKANIPECTFQDRFFLLREGDLHHGVAKAKTLLHRLSLTENRLIALRTTVPTHELRDNTRTGIGIFVERGHITLNAVGWVNNDETSQPEIIPIEEACALSLRLLHPELYPFEDLRPRSFSVLPVAKGCQAACPFCFSDASVSAEQDQARLDLSRVRQIANIACARGAERFVITGGGEPGLLRHEKLCALIATGTAAIGKSVLITNAHHLAQRSNMECAQMLSDYHNAGLRVLAISRHHHNDERSKNIMSLDTDVAAIATTWNLGRARWPDLRLRLTCVLQRGGVDSLMEIASYVSWAAAHGIQEICFKELYVSTSIESVYHRHAANAWSYKHQVPLSLILKFAARYNFRKISQLPWGSPVFAGEWCGWPIQIAAYTEPSLLWERSEGIARSWNFMADGHCLASLEDRASEIRLPVAT